MSVDENIRQIIKQKGHIKIDDMMSCVLSRGKNSYYKSVKNIGQDGDFITSPEISQFFGEIIAIWAIEKWHQMGRPSKFALVEFGPGRGILMKDFMRAAKLEPKFYNAILIYLYEINPYFIKSQKENLYKYINKLHWIDDIMKIPKIPIVFIANEFFDALPIKQYIKSENKWFENTLVLDPNYSQIKFGKTEINEDLNKYLSKKHVNAENASVLEESLESLEIIKILSRHLIDYGGAMLIIDYGYNIDEQTRKKNQYNSTLQAIKNHKYHPVLESLGEADLTTHVDFNALIKTVQGIGVKEYRYFSQRDFLLNYGIKIRFEQISKNISFQEQKILSNQVNRLISQNKMGELFKVLEVFVQESSLSKI